MAGEGIFKNWPNPKEQVSDRCPNCLNRTSLTLVGQRLVWPYRDDDVRALPAPQRRSLTEHFWRCDYCNHISIVWKLYGETEEDNIVRGPEEVRLAWPERAPRELPPVAPPEMRSLFREASVCENAGAMRGSAALYRAAVEELVKHQSVSGRDLYHRIEALEARGVDADIVRDLHEARLLGNWSLHEGIVFSPDEVADVANLITEAVEILYVLPARREEMRQAREARRESSGPEVNA